MITLRFLDGLRSFPPLPLSESRYPAISQPPASSAGHSLSPGSSASSPAQFAGRRTPYASDSRSAGFSDRDTLVDMDLSFPQLVDDLFRSEVLSDHLFPLFVLLD